MKKTRADGDSPRPSFWLSRRGAMFAVIAVHLAAVAAVSVEVVWPVTASKGHGPERVHALEFIASYAMYGFVACVLLVLVGILLRKLVMRDEDYYREPPR